MSQSRINYIKWITRTYSERVKAQEDFRIMIYDTNFNSFHYFKPLTKYTDQYKNRVLFRLYNVFSLPVYYWLTLTVRFDINMTASQYDKLMKNDYRKMWTSFYNYLRVYNDNLLYVRCYELTKNNILHVHVAFYSKVNNIIPALENHYKKFGFYKLFRFVGYESKMTDKSVLGLYARKDEYFRNNLNSKLSFWKIGKRTRVDYKLSNYILKYMLKNPSITHRALFSYYRIRTYSASRNLPLGKFIRTQSDNININHILSCNCQSLRYQMIEKGYYP